MSIPSHSFDPNLYLGTCSIIDYDAPAVRSLATSLSNGDVVRNCFEYVRDEIRHSSDFQLNPVTCKASEVVFHGTGFCYAKSHLLCALLRANRVPAGLSYQRLSTGDPSREFCLHGLVSVYLLDVGWYRLDPRGNKEGITAEFNPPEECLAFKPTSHGEADLEGIHVEPLPEVIRSLRAYTTWTGLENNLPDVSLR